MLEFVRKRGRLCESEARTLFSQICDAVSHCHERGVVHRNLNLQNILLGSGNSCKVTSFSFCNEVRFFFAEKKKQTNKTTNKQKQQQHKHSLLTTAIMMITMYIFTPQTKYICLVLNFSFPFILYFVFCSCLEMIFLPPFSNRLILLAPRLLLETSLAILLRLTFGVW